MTDRGSVQDIHLERTGPLGSRKYDARHVRSCFRSGKIDVGSRDAAVGKRRAEAAIILTSVGGDSGATPGEWNGERVLVTGSASFIGSHLMEDLVAEGACVRTADDFSSGRRDNFGAVAGEIEIGEGDLKPRAFADEAMESV
jgi:hypothetical protein